MKSTAEPNTEAPRQVPATAGNRWLTTARRLVLATMLYNVAEAGVALASGIAAGSIALVGFGLDSIIETAAAGVVLWRLQVEARGADREAVERSEQRVRRFVGGTFLALAAYVIAYSLWALRVRWVPDESWLGIGLAAASLVVMPLIAWWKIQAARHLGSQALVAEARETLACSYLSLTLLAGLAANAWLGWWWADPLAALLMVPWLVKEGVGGLRGEDRC